MRENIIIIPDFENIGSVGPAKHKINLVSPYAELYLNEKDNFIVDLNINVYYQRCMRVLR